MQRLDYLLTGHLSTCADPARPRTLEAFHSASMPRELPLGEGDTSQPSNLVEPEEEVETTDGMAMIFVEERGSAYFGESSNIHFIRLLIRIIGQVRRAPPTAQAKRDLEGNMSKTTIAQLPQSLQIPQPLQESSLKQLPPVSEMNAMLDIYFDSTGVLFPFICEDTMRKVYGRCVQTGFTKVRRAWLAVLNMVFALACNFDRGTASATERLANADVYYRRAQALCGDLSTRSMSLEIVQYLLLVVLYCQGTLQSIQAWNMHGMLVRSAMGIGLHTECLSVRDAHQEPSRRRTWMTIYCLDKVLSMTFGRPPAVADEWILSNESSTPPDSSSISAVDSGSGETGLFLSLSLQLYQIMGQSLTKQYGSNVRRTDAAVGNMPALQISGELREMLDTWRSNLPPFLLLCDSQSNILSENTKSNRLRVILTLRYHNVSILIHRPLLSATLHALFLRQDEPSSGIPSYLAKLATAEAHNCLTSAERTIEIVHGVLMADSTNNNNLGVWFFNLYYGKPLSTTRMATPADA